MVPVGFTHFFALTFRLLENVRVRRAGYAYRQVYAQFLYRYKMLCAKTWPSWRGGSAREGVRELFLGLDIDPDEYAFGITKIFIRNPQTVRKCILYSDLAENHCLGMTHVEQNHPWLPALHMTAVSRWHI